MIQTILVFTLRPDDGHVSVLGSAAVAALDWLAARA